MICMYRNYLIILDGDYSKEVSYIFWSNRQLKPTKEEYCTKQETAHVQSTHAKRSRIPGMKYANSQESCSRIQPPTIQYLIERYKTICNKYLKELPK